MGDHSRARKNVQRREEVPLQQSTSSAIPIQMSQGGEPEKPYQDYRSRAQDTSVVQLLGQQSGPAGPQVRQEYSTKMIEDVQYLRELQSPSQAHQPLQTQQQQPQRGPQQMFSPGQGGQMHGMGRGMPVQPHMQYYTGLSLFG